MKTNKDVLKTRQPQVDEIVEVMERINNESINSDKQGYTSVRIGDAYVYLKENENEDHYPTTGNGQVFLHIGDPKGAIYIANTIIPRYLQFKDNFGRIDHGRYFKAEEILSIRLFNDAYEKVINKLIEWEKYHNNIKKENEKQIALLQSI